MNRYRISKIGISNFKIFKEYFEKDFHSDDLVVFDGPNGFGKTSIFDAIELGLTGVIKRLDIYDESVKNQRKAHGFPFINTLEKDFYIKIELKSENGTLILCRFLSQEDLSSKEKGKLKWDKIVLGRLNNWEDSVESSSQISQDEFEALLGVRNLKRIFNVFFYVQQEENTFFLKRSESDRKEYLNILFDVDFEAKQLRKTKKLIKLHNEFKEEKKKQKTSLLESVVTFQDQNDVAQSFESIFNKDYNWDLEKPDFSKVKLEDLTKGLTVFGSLISDYQIYEQQAKAAKVRSFFSSPSFTQNFLLYANFKEKYEELEDLYKIGTRLRSLMTGLGNQRFIDLKHWDESEKFLKDVLDYDVKELRDLVELYLSLKADNDAIRNSRHEIHGLREKLSDIYKKHVEVESDSDSSDCPLCGNSWGSPEELFDAIEQQRKRFTDVSQEKVNTALRKLELRVKNLNELIAQKFKTTYYPTEKILTQVRTSLRSKEAFEVLVEFSKDCKFDLRLDENLSSLNDLNNLVTQGEKLELRLLELIEKQFTIEESDFLAMERIFLRYFNGEKEKLQEVSIEQIERKKKYLKFKYAEYIEQSNNSLNKQISEIDAELLSVKEKIAKIKTISTIYENKIRNHISRIISDISIPFFINSGRILQDFYGGNGIFVKMGDLKTDGVKFFSQIDKENDPLYSLSSGQISSLVLSFCLTLNDVYQDHYLGMILIDDPIQTMDEINTIMFIDLIRSTFKDRQFLISTHEETFSSLIRYKFKQSNSSVSVVRMKEAI